MKSLKFTLIITYLITFILLVGCSNNIDTRNNNKRENNANMNKDTNKDNLVILSDKKITELENDLSAIAFNGNYGFDEFLSQGGAASDLEVVQFLMNNVITNISNLSFSGKTFGCSTIASKTTDGEALFGRNFDWKKCNALIVNSKPVNGYSSISTVNTDFINVKGIDFEKLTDEIKAIIAMYAPLDGMNEKGLVISVNMIQDSDKINQEASKPNITTTTAIRLILNNAATVDETINLLEQYNMHSSMGLMVHFAISDKNGNSVAVEYVNNQMIVIDTPIVTNFYLAQGEKNNIGTEQSHTRYEILLNQLSKTPTMNMDNIRDVLSSVSKGNFGEFESTEWSIVYNQSSGEVRYYHRENYEDYYTFFIE